MKKLLLSVAILATSLAVNAVNKTWNFSDWATGNQTFPTHVETTEEGTRTISESTVVDGLSIVANINNVNMGAVNSTPKTISGVAYTLRFQTNGAGYGSGKPDGVPTQRFLAFKVTGPSEIQVAFITGSNSSTRSVIISDGTTALSTTPDSNTGTLATYFWNGGEKVLYVYGDAAINLYMVSATNVDDSYVYDYCSLNSLGSACEDAGFNPTTGEPCKVTGYYNLLGQKLSDEPAQGAYIVTYEDCKAEKKVK